jgi:hypothetical protein
MRMVLFLLEKTRLYLTGAEARCTFAQTARVATRQRIDP